MRVLVVDDEPLALAYLEKLTSRISRVTSVVSFHSASDALLYLEHESVDLLLLDIEMPDISGIEMAERVNVLYPDVLVVFVTGNRDYIMEDFTSVA